MVTYRGATYPWECDQIDHMKHHLVREQLRPGELEPVCFGGHHARRT